MNVPSISLKDFKKDKYKGNLRIVGTGKPVVFFPLLFIEEIDLYCPFLKGTKKSYKEIFLL